MSIGVIGTSAAQPESGGKKAYKGFAMEGWVARWYAKTTARGMGDFQKLARDLAGWLRSGDRVLEVAPGPGYLAIELARQGRYDIFGLDISGSFVSIARENAAKAGVVIDFRQGDAAAMPFAAESFDLVVCRAAFKNFSRPVAALNEMHRVLRPGGQALIIDLRSDASAEAIKAYVRGLGLSRINALMTRLIFKNLIKRAYSQEQMRQMSAATPFDRCAIHEDGIGFEASLKK